MSERPVYKEGDYALAYSPVEDGWCVYAPGDVVLGAELTGPFSTRQQARAAIAAIVGSMPPTEVPE